MHKELDEVQRQELLDAANREPHEGCSSTSDTCAGVLMAMPGGKTLCDYHRSKRG